MRGDPPVDSCDVSRTGTCIRLTHGEGLFLYRFGTTDEVGVLAMEPRGLVDVTNPSEMFMSNSVVSEGLEGSAVAITLEGTR